MMRYKHDSGETPEEKRKKIEKLYDQYHLEIYRNALLMTKSKYDAEDILQDTFINAFQYLDQLKDRGNARAWLFRIMVNLVYNKSKKKSRESLSEGSRVSMNERDINETVATSNDSHIADRLDIMNCLAELNEKQRTVLVLYYYDGFPVRDIARICGCKEGTVKSRLHKGRSELKRLLAYDEESTEYGKRGAYCNE